MNAFFIKLEYFSRRRLKIIKQLHIAKISIKFGNVISKFRGNMETLIPRFFKPSETGYFLFGPRGTGKSTFLRYHYPNALWIDLLKPDDFRKYSARPERLIERVKAHPEFQVIIIDEVQKVPELLSAVHLLVEENKSLQFILSGSSARKIKRKDVNLLGGRLVLRTMHPFLLAELGDQYSFDRALENGLIPLAVFSKLISDTLEAYVSLYIREEVQAEGLVRRIGDFSRFLEAISFSHASILNISNVARECQVERKTVENYVQILIDILIGFKLLPFQKKAKRKLATRPKFYFFDTGVYRTIRPKGPLDRPEEIGGSALEGLVAQHLRAWNAYKNQQHELFFWRSMSGVEVDFVLYGLNGIFAIEVKNTTQIRPQDLRGLHEFKKDYPDAKLVYLYRGNEKLLRNQVLCRPVDDFLKNLSISWNPAKELAFIP